MDQVLKILPGIVQRLRQTLSRIDGRLWWSREQLSSAKAKDGSLLAAGTKLGDAPLAFSPSPPWGEVARSTG